MTAIQRCLLNIGRTDRKTTKQKGIDNTLHSRDILLVGDYVSADSESAGSGAAVMEVSWARRGLMARRGQLRAMWLASPQYQQRPSFMRRALSWSERRRALAVTSIGPGCVPVDVDGTEGAEDV